MTVNFNRELLEHLPEQLEPLQRAFFYGDGLFETIRVFEGQIPLLPLHWERLLTGGQLLGLDFPIDWTTLFFENEILKVSAPNARVRLMVWRASGGLYIPRDNSALFLITTVPIEESCFSWPETGITVGLADSVRIPLDSLSNCKLLNAARYIAAAREAQTNTWDDALVLNAWNRVCEATSSNLFWFEEDQLCTVPLSEGCVAGVMRRYLLNIAPKAGYVVHEKPATFAALEQVEELFLTNAIRGILPVRKYAGKLFGQKRTRELFSILLRSICNA